MPGMSQAQRRKQRNEWAREDGYDSWKDYIRHAASLIGRPPERLCGAAAKKRDAHKDDFPGPGPKKPCSRPPVDGATRCHHHGGKSLVGPQNPNWKTGEHSRFALMPARISERARRHLSDPELMSVRNDIAASLALLDDLYEQLDTGESGEAWRLLRQALHDVQKARQAVSDVSKGTDEHAKAKRRLGRATGRYFQISEDLIDERLREDALRREIRETQEHVRKLRDSERRLMKDVNAFITADNLEQLAIQLASDAADCIRMVPDKGVDSALSEMTRRATSHLTHQQKDAKEIAQ